MHKTLICGGLGYIGSKLIPRLAHAGHDITVVDNLLFKQKPVLKALPYDFNFICDDVRNYNDFSKYDIIINLAAYVGLPLCKQIAEKEVISLNYEFVRDLTKKLSNQLLIFPSTNSSYGTSKDVICTEESELNPLSLYAETKDNAEKEVLKYKYGIAFRLATVCGVSPRFRNDLLVNNWCYEAYIKGELGIFEPQFRRNFVHIQDVTAAFEFAINHSWKMLQNTHNLGCDECNMTKEQLAQKICKRFGASLKHMNGYDADKRDYNISSAKLENLGFKAKITIDQAIDELAKFFYSGPKHLYSNV